MSTRLVLRALARCWLAVALCGSAFAHYTFQKQAGYLYVCTFNVYKLGSIEAKYDQLEEGDAEAETGIPRRIKSLARVLATADFDLIVLQEVTHGEKGQWAVADLVQELNTVHQRQYQFFLSDHIGQGLMPEAMAFIFDPHKVRSVPFSGNTVAVNIPVDGRDLVKTKWVSGNFDFLLVSAHLAWGNEADRKHGDKVILEILTNPSKYSDDPDVLVVGDVNRFGEDFTFFETLPSYSPSLFLAPNVTFFDPAFKSKKQVKAADIAGKGVPGNDPQLLSTTVATNTFVYDVFLMTPDVDEELPGSGNELTLGTDWGIVHFDEPNGFGYQQGAKQLGPNDLKEEYSDHRPLWMRFATMTTNADGGGNVVAPAQRFVATASGRKFHKPECPTVANSTVAVTWTDRGAAMATHGPCGVCKP